MPAGAPAGLSCSVGEASATEALALAAGNYGCHAGHNGPQLSMRPGGWLLLNSCCETPTATRPQQSLR